MAIALFTISIIFAIGGFICLHEEQDQTEELTRARATITAQQVQLKQDSQLIEDMGYRCQ